MCLAAGDPGGPRRCSGDGRAALSRAVATVEALEQRQADILAFQAPLGAAQLQTLEICAAPPYHLWEEYREGHYGCVRISPDGTRAVKELLPGPDGEPGEFGDWEIEVAYRMGQLGHSPVVHRASETHLEMDFVPGGPLWAGYKPEEGESVMNPGQTRKLAAALKDLHLMGFFHGDLHVRQILVDADQVKLVDFGAAGRSQDHPLKCLHDLNKIRHLAAFDNPELAGDPYIDLVNRHLDRYRAVTGVSAAAREHRITIARDYLRELEELR